MKVVHCLFLLSVILYLLSPDIGDPTRHCHCVYMYVIIYVRASVSGLLRPFLSCGFYPLNLHSFIATTRAWCERPFKVTRPAYKNAVCAWHICRYRCTTLRPDSADLRPHRITE